MERSTYGVVRLNERIVDSNNLDIGVLDGVAEDDTADTTETVDADLDGSHFDYRISFCLEGVKSDEKFLFYCRMVLMRRE